MMKFKRPILSKENNKSGLMMENGEDSKNQSMAYKSVVFKTWNPLVNVIYYINVIMFFLSLIINFDKPSFISMILTLLYIFWWHLKDNNYILFRYQFILLVKYYQ